MRSADSEDGPDNSVETTDETSKRRVLLSSLEGLLRGLGHLPGGDANWRAEGLTVQLWSDPEYIYAEAELTNGSDLLSDLDIFIGEGKAFLRLER